MNWDAIGAIGEVFGALAVVISVVYLAVQVRKQIEESRLSATRDLHEHYQTLLASLTSDPTLTDLYGKGVQDYDSLPNTERLRLSIYFQRLFRQLEQVFLHTTKGNLDPGFFRSIDSVHLECLTFPGIQQWWAGSKQFFDEAFRSHTDRMLVNAKEKGYISSFRNEPNIPSESTSD